ncbi:sulfatase [Halobacteriaceae archaeon SHR40]|uniref:sulfatase n=1 Tax=Halovenus amylolytica TaxID=2500550 RepID=UPI000FE360FB
MTETPTGRNIVMLSVDSLRADYCYDESLATPAIDALADSGCRFENAIAPGPATYESMPAIFTGIQPGPSGPKGGINKRERIKRHVRAHRPLAERLRERGYTTIGVTPNPFTSRQFGFDTGFDKFVDFFDSSGFGGGLRSRIVSRWADGEFVGGLRFASNMLGLGDVSVSCSTVVSRAIEELEDASEPFFLWMMFLDPHWPYRPPTRYHDGTGIIGRYRANWRASNLSDSTPSERDDETLRTLYNGTVKGFDDCLERIRNELRPFDPAYVLHSDHGEAFGEHGQYGHGGALYEENIRVPLLVGNIGNRTRVENPVSLQVIPRLITSLCNGEIDLSAFTTDQTYAISERGDICVRGSGWKYYLGKDERSRLYNLRTDPGEQDGIEIGIESLESQYRNHLCEITDLERAAREQVPIKQL